MGKGEATRTRILDQAITLASRVGLEGLTLGVLAENLGVSKSGLYAHFRSKEALVLAVVAHARARHLEYASTYMDGKGPGLERVRAYFQAWLDWTALPTLPGGCPIMGACFEFEDLEGRARDTIVELMRNSRTYLASLLQQAMANHQLTEGMPVDQVVFEMRGIVFAFHVEHRLMREPAARMHAEQAFETLLGRYQDNASPRTR